MKAFKISGNTFKSFSQCKSALDQLPFYVFVERHSEDDEEEKKRRSKEVEISAQSLSPFQDKQIFQTQIQPSPVKIPPTRVPDTNAFGPYLVLKTKYFCPNCQLGELVLNYEHVGDFRYDYCIYQCCSPCMIFCPNWCGGTSRYRICTICKTEYHCQKKAIKIRKY